MTENNTIPVKQQVKLLLDSWLVVGLAVLSWMVVVKSGWGNGWAGMALGVVAVMAAVNAEKVAVGVAVAMVWSYKLMHVFGWGRMPSGYEKFTYMVGAVIGGALVVVAAGRAVGWWREKSKPKDW